jgi:hypothetical protein
MLHDHCLESRPARRAAPRHSPPTGAKEVLMLRRLYFVIPDEPHAVEIVKDLEAAGVDRGHIHAIPGKGVTLTQLPPATERQLHDAVWRMQKALWNSNLIVFGVAALGLAAALYAGSAAGALTAAVIMAASFTSGALFALRVPDTHLDEFRGALAHPNVLLMVDVPKRRVAEIETLVARRHPEAESGGSGWTMDAFGV